MREGVRMVRVLLRLEGVWLGDLGNRVGWVRSGKIIENLGNYL